MRLARPGRAWIVPALSAGAVAALVACSSSAAKSSSPLPSLAPAPLATAAPAPAGAAASALASAARTMATASSYRFNASITVQNVTTKVVGEFQAPDRIHETIGTATATVAETIFVGGQVFVHDPATHVWHPAQKPAGASSTDPRLAFTVVQQAQNVTASGSTMTFTLPAAAVSQLLQAAPGDKVGEAHGAATLAAGGLSHLELTVPSAQRTVRVSLDYADIGSAPPVTAPVAA